MSYFSIITNPTKSFKMKKNILKSILCVFLVGLIWSCTNENDVQMQSGEAQLKSGSVWDREIGIDLGNGVYQITASTDELIKELERLAVMDGYPVEINTLDIVKLDLVNDPDNSVVVLMAGTGNMGMGSSTIGIELGSQEGGLFIAHPTAGPSGPQRIMCRGCGMGCFLEYYNIDGIHVPYCAPAGCGADCEKIKRKS